MTARGVAREALCGPGNHIDGIAREESGDAERAARPPLAIAAVAQRDFDRIAFAAEPSETPAFVAMSRIGLLGMLGSVSKVKMTRRALADPITSWPDPTGSCSSRCLPVIKT